MSVTRSSPVVTKWVTQLPPHLQDFCPVETVPACPVPIGAHRHIDVCTDINNSGKCIKRNSSGLN